MSMEWKSEKEIDWIIFFRHSQPWMAMDGAISLGVPPVGGFTDKQTGAEAWLWSYIGKSRKFRSGRKDQKESQL